MAMVPLSVLTPRDSMRLLSSRVYSPKTCVASWVTVFWSLSSIALRRSSLYLAMISLAFIFLFSFRLFIQKDDVFRVVDFTASEFGGIGIEIEAFDEDGFGTFGVTVDKSADAFIAFFDCFRVVGCSWIFDFVFHVDNGVSGMGERRTVVCDDDCFHCLISFYSLVKSSRSGMRPRDRPLSQFM